MRDDPSVVALVTRAAGSDEGAWHELVDRYAPLVWSICVRYQLGAADIEDVGQTVWLGLVEQLANEKLREPAALPGWLATTTQRECLRVLRARGKYEVFGTDPDDGGLPLAADATVIEEEILLAERNALLRAALAEHEDKLNRAKIERLLPFGGIRVEDDIEVTQDGCKNLTREAFAALADTAPGARGRAR